MPVVREHPHAALRKHDVVIQLIGQLLVELDRKFVKGSRFREEIIRADDRRVAAGVAAADPAALDERDVGETMVLRKIISGREAMPAATDNRSEEHTSELQSLMRNSYAVFCLKKK